MTDQDSAGWHVDPSGRYERRYWDGTQWTQHVTTGGRQGIDQLVGPAPVTTTTATRPGAGWYPDPAGGGGTRYWDGSQWTSHRGAGTLFTEQLLVVNQQARVFRSTVGYAIYNEHGQQLGTVQEIHRDLSEDISASLRGRAKSRRIRRFRVVDTNGRVLLEMTRPEMGWFETKATLVIDGPAGTPVGQIVHESFGLAGGIATAAHAGVTNASMIAKVGLGGFRGKAARKALEGIQDRLDSAVEGLDEVGHARFGLEADGQRLGSINTESITQWDFNVQDPTGTEVGRITKTWAGWAKERFTKADNYVVQMHRPLEEPLRSLVIAAALAIDVELKERGPQTRGSSVWGTRHYK